MTSSDYISAVIEKLDNWREYDFHRDRQLADEVLIADGWKCEPDAGFEGGVRWFIGPYSCSEGTRPHVIHSLDRALAVVPHKYNVELTITCAIGCGAKIWPNGEVVRFTATAPIASVAVLIAALKAKRDLLKARAA